MKRHESKRDTDKTYDQYLLCRNLWNKIFLNFNSISNLFDSKLALFIILKQKIS